jgi:hypothetical protein
MRHVKLLKSWHRENLGRSPSFVVRRTSLAHFFGLAAARVAQLSRKGFLPLLREPLRAGDRPQLQPWLAHRVLPVMAVAILVFNAPVAYARDWTGAGVNRLFSNDANWSAPPANGVPIRFSDTGTSASQPALVDPAWNGTNGSIIIGAGALAGSGDLAYLI